MAHHTPEKAAYGISDEHEQHQVNYPADRKKVAVGEGAELYGDVQTAEEYGYVERG